MQLESFELINANKIHKSSEAHVRLLREANQPIPQPLNLLLADARRKEEKRTAKRVANRKSACTSRARKKALVEEMTRTNAKLKRQALILSLLPDLVVAITVDGEITFCSAQVSYITFSKHFFCFLIANLRSLSSNVLLRLNVFYDIVFMIWWDRICTIYCYQPLKKRFNDL